MIEEIPVNETSSLIKKETHSLSESGWVIFTDWTGGLLTFSAMVPQGFLGVLLTDLALKSLGVSNIYYRLLPDGIMFFTSEEGKRQQVRFFNTETFKNFGRAETWHNFFDVSQWKAADYVIFPLNTIASIVPSGAFAYITHLAFEGMSPLFKAYNTPLTDFLASTVLNPWVQRPFMGASFICNMFGFPNIHKGMANLIKNDILAVVENPEFRLIKEKLHLDMEATRLREKQQQH